MIESLKLVSYIFRIGSIQQLMLSSHPSILYLAVSCGVCRQHSPVVRTLDVSSSSINLYAPIFNCAYIRCSLLGVSQLNRIQAVIWRY